MAIKKEETSLDSSVNRLQNRVAVPKYYFDKLPKDLRALSFYVSNLEKLREIEMVKRSLKNAIEKGESFEQWRANLNIEGIRNLSRSRLETVYRTNVSTVYNQSARYNAFHSDVTPYLMYTAIMDGRTRPEHAKLNGVVKRADSTFWDKYTAPISFNCTSFNQKVSGKFTKGFRSSYKGDMVSIKLKSGKRIVGLTLNHPVATEHGFIKAKNLYSGDKVFLNPTETKDFNMSWNIDNKYITPTASNVFKSMFLKALSVFKSTSFNFHGDIEFMDKEVDVISCNSFLSGDSKSTVNDSKNIIFKLSNYVSRYFPFSTIRKAIGMIHLNARFFKNLCNKALRDTERGGYVVAAKIFIIEIYSLFLNMFNILSYKALLRPIPWFNAERLKPSDNRISTDAELLTKFENAKSLFLESDEIVKVQFYPYFGFVYDFESLHGLVITDDLATSNCRCGVVPLSKEDADEIGISKRSNQSFPEPEQGFGTKKMGDMLSPVREEAEGAIDALPKNSPYRAKFKEAVEGVDSLVDIWYKKNEDIFNP